ncbi:MAG: BrnT family toxin [Patescibacteria group bacterium]
MIDWGKCKDFEWDKWNIDKSYQKHGITPNESEEAFLDEKAIVLKDFRHSQKEKRYSLLGKTTNNKLLFIVFTLRTEKVRIISARKANKKERSNYGKKA